MAIKIGHASIDERGKAKGGSAGDQTGKEVTTRNWYSKPWTYVLRCKDSNKAEKMAQACEKGCSNNNIGYDQYQRNTLNTQAKKVDYDLSKITTKCETDCSAFMTVCAQAAGINVPYNSGNAPTTSTMKSAFTSTGMFEVLTSSKYLTSDAYLKRGDILVKPGSHTVMALENGSKVSSSSSSSLSSSSKSIIAAGQQHAINFTGVTIAVDGIVGSDTNKMKVRVLQRGLNLDYGNSIKEDGINGGKTRAKLGSHYVAKGEKQYMVTAAEILMMLNGIDPNGVELPGVYGTGLVNAAKKFFGDDGLKITASEFLKLI